MKAGNGLFWHQYMTNVLAPYSESKSIYNGYSKSGLLSTTLSFVIPVFQNMPEIPTESPNINSSDFVQDNTKVYCNGNNVNVRTGPSTSYEVITTLNQQDKMTRIKKGRQAGERWDKVKLDNGIIGYIYASYITEVPPVQIEKIDLSLDNTTLQKGETKSLQVTILPPEASTHKVSYQSSNQLVATVDDKGKIQALRSGETTIIVKAEENNVQSQITVKVYSKVTGISLDQEEIYLNLGETFQIKANIEPEDADEPGINYQSSNAEIATKQENGIITAKQIGETQIIASSKENPAIQAKGKVVVVRNMEDSEIDFESPLVVNGLEMSGLEYNKNTQYSIILYGDANGDGKINSVDLLVLQRHILEIEPIETIFRKATNINKNGKKPSSVDLLLIQRHILGLQIIQQ